MSNETSNVVKIKPSLVPFTWKGLVVLGLGVVLLVGVLVFQPLNLPLGFSSILTIASLGVVVLGLLMILVGAIRRNTYTYQLTDSHIIIQKQLLGRSVRRIPYGAISDVEVSQSFVGRLAGYGNIVPVTKSGYGLVRGIEPTENRVSEMTNVPHPDEVANTIMSRASLVARAIAQ